MNFFGSKKSITSQTAAQPNSPAAPQDASAKTYAFDDLTSEQFRVLEELEKGNCVVVDSIIGAGKTKVLQAVADGFPNSRVLYLTYNRLLKMDAQERIKNRNATVQNYHGFVYKYLIRKNIKVPPDKQIKAFLQHCKDVPLIYDIICIDEYQDLEEDTVELLLHLNRECPRALWVFVGDMAQKIYDKTKIDVYRDCIEQICPDYVPLSFTQSFRISSGLADTLSKMWGKKIVGVNDNCQVSVSTSLAEVFQLMDDTPNKDLLVLGPRYGLTQELVNILERRNPKKYNKQTVWTSIADRDDGFKVQPDSMIVTTYDGCKGMERRVCVVMDWTDVHYATRASKPFVDPKIVRNLFCVAASRGKDKIVFYLDPTRDSHLLNTKDIANTYTQVLPDFSPSQMFSFKHPADIRACMDDLYIEDVAQEDREVIETTKADGNIDLTPAIGKYQEIAFFKEYSFQREVDSLLAKPILGRVKKWIADQSDMTPEKKALALTAYNTELFRYCNQARQDFISPEMHDKLIARLSTKLDPKSTKVQVHCHIVSEFTATGFIDYVDKNNIPWELKFVSVLNNEHYLQAAMYSLMYKSKFTYLWNTRTNELKKVVVKDREKFLRDVYKCITMGRQLRR